MGNERGFYLFHCEIWPWGWGLCLHRFSINQYIRKSINLMVLSYLHKKLHFAALYVYTVAIFTLCADNPLPCVARGKPGEICNGNLPRLYFNPLELALIIHLILWPAPPCPGWGELGHTSDIDTPFHLSSHSIKMT